jgi:hypothetical protein
VRGSLYASALWGASDRRSLAFLDSPLFHPWSLSLLILVLIHPCLQLCQDHGECSKKARLETKNRPPLLL